jgi:hypothetical protein
MALSTGPAPKVAWSQTGAFVDGAWVSTGPWEVLCTRCGREFNPDTEAMEATLHEDEPCELEGTEDGYE